MYMKYQYAQNTFSKKIAPEITPEGKKLSVPDAAKG
jgi:hypothetical protein